MDDSGIPPDSFYINVVGKGQKDGHGNYLKSVKLPRGIPLLDAMQASDAIILTEPQIGSETDRFK